MDRIRILSDDVKKKIAAGEVVEGPYSIIKELVENSIDAGSSRVDIQVYEGGIKKVVVRDDGEGMYRDDIPLSIMEHATSKIEDIHDIERVNSYGFRGEALSSISSVSRISILSRRSDENTGGRLSGGDGGFDMADYAGPSGTTVIVENLFYNVPARKKFLKSPRAELRSIREILIKTAIPHPGISFSFDVDDKRQFTLAACESVEQRLGQIYGESIMNDLRHETLQDLKVSISGFFSLPHFIKNTRSMQMLYVNQRPVEHRYLGFLLGKAYESIAARGKYPAGIIFIEIDPGLVDINIHPAKKEVRMFDTRYIDGLILALAEKALNREHTAGTGLFKQVVPGGPEKREFGGPGAPAGASRNRGPDPPGYSGPGPNDKPGVLFDYNTMRSFVRDVADLYHDLGSREAMRIIGVVFGTYIMLEKNEFLYFIDFHAAHERVLFDSIMSRSKSSDSQRLAFPRVVELSLDDHALVLENIKTFSEIGFDMEDFSDNSIKITAVPEIARGTSETDLLFQILESIRGERGTADIFEKIAATVACHSARRAGDAMTPDDMQRLADDIFNRTVELRCPHGRPFVYRMAKQDIERMFKRK